MKNKYLEEFYGYKCHDDVLASVSKLHNPAKEITESMAIIKRIRPIILARPGYYDVVDLCAGNALTSVLAAHLFPTLRYSVALDKQKRQGDYEKVKKFGYSELDIKRYYPVPNDIFISVHPCQAADLIVNKFVGSEAKALIMMPCCEGSSGDVVAGSWLMDCGLSRYDLWTYHLASRLGRLGQSVSVKVYKDGNVLSPKNNVIVAVRR